MAGRRGKVSRFVTAATLVVLVTAGCGGAARPQASGAGGIPRVLAREWAARASAIADAAAAGNGCRALRLANSLRDRIVAEDARLPPRLRSPLETGVNALADRLACTQTVTVQTTPQKPKPPHKPPDHHHKHGDHKGEDR